MGAGEGGVVGPGGGAVGKGAEEEVDEEGGVGKGGFVDADVGEVLVVGGGVALAGGGSGAVGGAFGEAAGGVVEGVEFGADVGGKLGGVNVPVDDFRVGVAE